MSVEAQVRVYVQSPSDCGPSLVSNGSSQTTPSSAPAGGWWSSIAFPVNGRTARCCCGRTTRWCCRVCRAPFSPSSPLFKKLRSIAATASARTRVVVGTNSRMRRMCSLMLFSSRCSFPGPVVLTLSPVAEWICG